MYMREVNIKITVTIERYTAIHCFKSLIWIDSLQKHNNNLRVKQNRVASQKVLFIGQRNS